jgi:hypothetical protein
MDELEVLIAIVVGLYKLVRFILRTLFRGVASLFSVGRRAFRPTVTERAAPARMMKAAPARRAQPARPAARPLARSPHGPPPLAPPPLALGAVAPAPDRVVDAYAETEREQGWLTPELARDAILLDALLNRRR